MWIKPRSLLHAAALAGVGLAVVCVATRTAEVRADEIDDKLAELKELHKAGEERQVIAKMVLLENEFDSRVTKAFIGLTKSKFDKVATNAIKSVAKRKDKKFLKTVKSKLGDKKLRKKKPEMYIPWLDAAAIYGDKSLLKPLEDVIKKYLPTNPDFSTKAIEAYGAVPEKAVVDRLLEWLKQTDTSGRGGQGGGGGGSTSTVTLENYEEAKEQILDTLSNLTGQDIDDAVTWNKWWEKNRKDFVFPDPNAEEVDVTTLKEFTDGAYGWTAKLPAATGWSFLEAENTRVRARWVDPTEMEFIRVDYGVYNMNSGSFKTPQALGDYWVKDWKENHFDGDSLRGSGEIEEVKLNKREWFVTTLKGQSAKKSRGWGGVERKLYMTKMDHLVLYVMALIRLGADDTAKKDCVTMIEGTVFK